MFFTDIPSDRNIFGDNIATKKVDYVIPENILEKMFCGVMFSFVTCLIKQRPIQNPVSNITIESFYFKS